MAVPASSARPFRLLRYFRATSLVAFCVFGLALYLLERSESRFFDAAQREQMAFVAQSQEALLRQQAGVLHRALVGEHENAHLTLMTVASNALWQTHFAPLVAKAQSLPVAACRGRPAAEERKACFAALGSTLRSLAEFTRADAQVRTMMARTRVSRVNVFDLRGLTVYSSEQAQVGEDEAENAGWLSAANGRVAIGLVHRGPFNAFDGMAGNRDLIQGYLPVLDPRGQGVLGVFEVYSDVTSILAQTRSLSAQTEDLARLSAEKLEESSAGHRRSVATNSSEHFAILALLMLALYASLLVLAVYAQRVIDEQARAGEQSARRERLFHREKMAALAALAAEASHDVGNPLAVIASAAEDLAQIEAAGDKPQRILEQVQRIAQMARRINEFTANRGEIAEPVDVDGMVAAMCDFLGFDERFRATPIERRLAGGLPACLAVPAHLEEVLMGLLMVYVEAAAAAGTGLVVSTTEAGGEIVVAFDCTAQGPSCPIAESDPRFASARGRVGPIGGKLALSGSRTELTLPCHQHAA